MCFTVDDIGVYRVRKRNTIIYLLSDLLSKGVPFLLLPIVTRFLLPNDFGILSLYLMLFEVFLILIVCGGNSYYRVNYFKKDLNDSDKNKIFSNGIIVSIVLGILSILLISIITEHIDVDIDERWLLIIPVICVCQVFIIYGVTYYQCKELAFKVTAINISVTILSNAVFVFLLNIGFGFESKILGLLFSVVIISLTLLFLGKLPFYSYNFDFTVIKSILLFGITILPHALSWWFKPAVDRLVISSTGNMDIVGIYSLVIQLSLPIPILINAINQAVNPIIYKELEGGNNKYVFKYCIKICLFVLLACFGYMFFTNVAFELLFNEEYYKAKSVMLLLIPIMSLQSIIIIFSNVLYHYKLQAKLSFISFVAGMLHVMCSMLLYDEYGLYAFVISYFVSYSIPSIVILLLALQATNRNRYVE